MTPKTVLKEMVSLLTKLLEVNIAVDYHPPILREEPGRSLITWANAPQGIFDIVIGEFTSITEYRSLVSGRHYHCMLYDGALLQFGYVFDGDTVVKHRLCYYPCPFDITNDDMASIQPGDDFVTLLDILLEEDVAHLQGCLASSTFADTLKSLRLRSPLRFDYDPAAQREGHPASHLHILRGNCRWPVYGPLSVGHFSRFVFRNLYPDEWVAHPFFGTITMDEFSRSITTTEMGDLFIEWQKPA